MKKYPIYRVNSVTGHLSVRLFSSKKLQHNYHNSLENTYFNSYFRKKDAKKFQKQFIKAIHKKTR
jgi:hypothetical protein